MWWRLAGCLVVKVAQQEPNAGGKGAARYRQSGHSVCVKGQQNRATASQKIQVDFFAGWFGWGCTCLVRLGVVRVAWVVAAPASPLAAAALPAAAARQLARHAAAACGHWTCHPAAGGRESCGASGWGCTSAGEGRGNIGERRGQEGAAGCSGWQQRPTGCLGLTLGLSSP